MPEVRRSASAAGLGLLPHPPGTGAELLSQDGDGRPSTGERLWGLVLTTGLTTWVQVGLLVRRVRGRVESLDGLDRAATFHALVRLVEAALDLPGSAPSAAGDQGRATLRSGGVGIRVLHAELGPEDARRAVHAVLRPYAAAFSSSRAGEVSIGWYAVRRLIAVGARRYSLQVVIDPGPEPATSRVSLILPPEGEEGGSELRALGAAAGARLAGLARARHARTGPDVDVAARERRDYLGAFCERLRRQALLEPASRERADRFGWQADPAAPGAGAGVAATLPPTVTAEVALRLTRRALAELAQEAGLAECVPVGAPQQRGGLLVARWTLDLGSPAGRHLLSVATRTGGRRRPTEVMIHLVPDPSLLLTPATVVQGGGGDAAPVDPLEVRLAEASALTTMPLWWRSAGGRCDGNDVILYEAPFRGQRLRVRANDHPAEAMYTLLVGPPGDELASLDLAEWPQPWVRPQLG